MGERIRGILLWSVSIAVLAFLVLPLLVIVPISFSSASFLSLPIPGFSLRWYEALLTSEAWGRAFLNSLIVGSIATTIAVVLGTLAAVGLHRNEFRGKALLMGVLISPMIVPIVIVALGSYFFYAPLGLASSLLGLGLAHAALGAPFVLITVSATLTGFDANLARAAASLGASPLTVFRRVTLPLIAPGVISGALFAFIYSFDEVVVALFIGGPEQRALPRQMFDGIRDNIDPSILAMSTILVGITIAFMAVIAYLGRKPGGRGA